MTDDLKPKTFLALTALKEFWDVSQSILFLGEWCKPYKNKSVWENLDTELLKTNLPESCNSFQAYTYTIDIYEKLLPELSRWLNQFHKTQYSLKYWRMVIGPFLLWYIQIVHQRLTSLNNAYSQYPDLETIGLSVATFMTPINTREFYMFASESDAWNHQLLTQLLELTHRTPATYKNYSWDSEIKQRQNVFGKTVSYKKITQLKINLMRLLIKWQGSKVVGLCVCVHEFSKKNLLKLILKSKFRILPLTEMKGGESANRENKPNLLVREQLAELKIPDDFSLLVLKTLKFNMPLNFIEYYKEEAELSEKSYPYTPGAIANTGWMQHDQVKLWGAKKAEQGTKLINIQHGGGYGMAKFFTSELLERQNCDNFISWGWKDGAEIIEASSILVCERNEERRSKQPIQKDNNLILWVATDAVTYPPFIGSYLGYMNHIYLDWQARFANTLTQDVFSQVTMRLRPDSKYNDQIRDLFPKLKIHLPKERSSYFDQLYSAKIVISDNFHTTFLYALAFDIPTILFWDKTFWQIRDEIKPYFKTLHSVGIYHETPESAGEMLNQICLDPEKWWQRDDVKAARLEFCDKFARANPEWLDEWREILLSFSQVESREHKMVKATAE